MPQPHKIPLKFPLLFAKLLGFLIGVVKFEIALAKLTGIVIRAEALGEAKFLPVIQINPAGDIPGQIIPPSRKHVISPFFPFPGNNLHVHHGILEAMPEVRQIKYRKPAYIEKDIPGHYLIAPEKI
jgi:hypothetical protein